MSLPIAGSSPSAPSLDHLAALTDRFGLFEHADGHRPRLEHGYCLDDVARALSLVVQLPRDPTAAALVEPYSSFVDAAIVADGRAHNRRDHTGRWTDHPGLGDWWGRALAALGASVAHSDDDAVRRRSIRGFERAVQARSPHLRTNAYAAIGAADLRACIPVTSSAWRSATALLHDAVMFLSTSRRRGSAVIEDRWLWPEPRLGYANAVVPEALIATGIALEDSDLVREGLRLLAFLLEKETRNGHLSVTGIGGRGIHDDETQFDQQPVEVAAIAEAAWRALQADPDPRWADAIRMAWAWFEGDNDAGVPMVDTTTGAGFDGLHRTSRNSNRGAESTISALTTQVRRRDLERSPQTLPI